MSSLQRAVEAAKQSTPTYLTSHGQFERSFASGLDLTEFGNSSKADDQRESAASHLLRVKAKERKIKEDEEIAEQRLQEIIKDRSAQINEVLRKQKQEGNVVVNTLVQMHASDTSDLSMFRKNKKLNKKLNSDRRRSGGASTATTAKKSMGKAHKKSSRSKH